MTADELITALGLPDSCRVDQRISKKMLIENSLPAPASTQNKRLINEHIETIQWLAALKPHTIGVPSYRDTVREYLEIAVVSVTLRPLQATVSGVAQRAGVAELIQRAIPYPMLLLVHSEGHLMLSLAHKRWAQNEADKVVLDGNMILLALHDDVHDLAFTQAFSLGRQPQTTLYALYDGWIDCVLALQAARLSGVFKLTTHLQHMAERRQALQDCQRLQYEASNLHAQAAKATQLARQVELNLALTRVKSELSIAKTRL